MRIQERFLLTLIVVGCASGAARPAHADKVDDYLQAQIGKLHIPGLSIAVVRAGQIVKAQGYGYADLERQAPATKDTVFEIGSNTKQFTASAVMMLAAEGKLNLDDSVTKYFPEAPATWADIKIRHLLSHTSGIQNHVAVPGYMEIFKTSLGYETTPVRDELLKKFFSLPREFKPGETWAYDNTGYYLLGLIIEKVSGKSYWQYLNDRIFGPLGMLHTQNTDPKPIVPHRASGYEWVKDRYENRPILMPNIALSAGAILSTVEDLAKWDRALYQEKLLNKNDLQRMWSTTSTNDGSPAPFNYGFGWFIDSFHGHRLVQHSGGTPGFSSVIYRYLDDKLTVIILSNAADRIIDQLAIDVAGMYVPDLTRRLLAQSEPAMTRKVTDVLENWIHGTESDGLVTRPMEMFLHTATGRSLGQWFGSLGEIEQMALFDTEQVGTDRILRFRTRLGENDYWFSARMTKDEKISQIYWW